MFGILVGGVLFGATAAAVGGDAVESARDVVPLAGRAFDVDEDDGRATTTDDDPAPAAGDAGDDSAVLHDNGPLVTSPGTGVGGADESVLQNTTLLMELLGFGDQLFSNRIADDFTVTDPGGWNIDTIKFYAYQTNSATASTISVVNYRIWDGPPGDPSSTIVFGDHTTNRLVTSTWSNIFRVNEATSGASNARPIMETSATAGVNLPPGSYWLDWQSAGDGALSGPWAPMVTIAGQATTGNALQFTSSGMSWSPAMDGGSMTPQDFPFILEDAIGTVLHDNGPLVNGMGTGVGGADESIVQTSLAMTSFGLGHQFVSDNRIADDFTVDPGGWTIERITFYAYQTGSTTASTIGGVNLRIWDGPPDDPTSSVVFGDILTNRLLTSTWANMYRVTQNTTAPTDRPVMANVVSVGTTLAQGTYWLDWQAGGTLVSGPWAPPVTINGQATTGNALQFTNGSGTWSAALDSGTNTQQDFPFFIEDAAGCALSSIQPIQQVQAVRAGATLEDVELTWLDDFAASDYNTWWVDNDRGLTGVPDARSGGSWPSVPGCLQSAATTCTHAGAMPASGELFLYQVRGACGAQEAAE